MPCVGTLSHEVALSCSTGAAPCVGSSSRGSGGGAWLRPGAAVDSRGSSGSAGGIAGAGFFAAVDGLFGVVFFLLNGFLTSGF